MTIRQSNYIFKKVMGIPVETFLERTVEAYFDACDEFRAKGVKADYVPGQRSLEQTCCTIEKSVGKRALFAVR